MFGLPSLLESLGLGKHRRSGSHQGHRQDYDNYYDEYYSDSDDNSTLSDDQPSFPYHHGYQGYDDYPSSSSRRSNLSSQYHEQSVHSGKHNHGRSSQGHPAVGKHRFGKIKCAAHLPHAREAQRKLEEIAQEVEPIMRMYGWRIGKLEELPPERRLGLSLKGEWIKVTLRDLDRPNRFISKYGNQGYVDTLLHELAHMRYGPHGRRFHELWGQLRWDYDRMYGTNLSSLRM
jgi:hypothetical protein